MGNLTRISVIMAALVVVISLIFFISKESTPEPQKVAERMVATAGNRNITLERIIRKSDRIFFDAEKRLFMRSESQHYSGMYLDYYSNGRLKAVVNFLNGRPDGYILTFHRSGKKRDFMHYKNGLRDGSWKRYNAFGALIMEGRFENDVKTGVWKVYFPSGTVRYTATFEHGLLLEKKHFDFHAEVKSDSSKY